jgi:osmoprotectant transport system permease protein
VLDALRYLPSYLTAHLQLVLFAILIGTIASIPLGILLSRRARFGQPVLFVVNTIQTIPALALLALMVPVLAAMHLPSIGYLPAFIALALYSVLPILRNTVSGLANVDPAMVEAARAVGMTTREQLLRVELPLATPVIVAGVRTAMAWTVGMATLSTPVGGLSLGNYIFSGLQTRNYGAVLVGCLAAAGLALLLDALLGLLARGLARRRRGLVVTVLLCLLALYAYAGASLGVTLFENSVRPIVIGAKNFTEQYILSEMLAERIRRASGRRVLVRPSLGSTVAFDALRDGQIDAYVDYSGTLWTTILKNTGTSPSRDQLLAETRRFLRDQHGIRLVATLGFENAYALAMRRSQAQKLGITRISELAAYAERLSLGTDYEFLLRPEWKAIERVYGLRFAAERSMDPSLMYEAIEQGGVEVISAFTTDARIVGFDLVLLDDDRSAIPPYDAVILVGRRLWQSDPGSTHALESLDGRIDAQAMRNMNLLVDSKHQAPETVARDFLQSLTKASPTPTPPAVR